MTVDEKDEATLERSPAEVWEKVRELLSKKLPFPTYQSWILPVQVKSINENEVTITVVNSFGRDVILNRHRDVIRNSFSQVLERDVQLNVLIDETPRPPDEYTPSIAGITVVQPTQATAPTRNPANEGSAPPADEAFRAQVSNLNPKYTWDTFVVGSHNRFCHSAAMAVAERPGQTYNPLFVYGGVGLGKTHVMQAIGHAVLKNNPRMSVRYLTCEKFTNDLINSIRENRMIDFRKRYRQVDVLLIDDIQFIEGKESTQEEFFHTFNALRESGRQIILSSDRPPKDIPKIEDRLRSRFEWGLIADMQPPDLETRLAILRKKCESDRMVVSDAVLEYIAVSFTNNIRELEGALLRAHAYASLSGAPLNIQTAADVLKIGTPVSNRPTLTMENIIGAVAAHYRVDTSDLRSAKRSKDLAYPRHIAMFLAHDLLSMSHSRIGECFGNRKHSSVIYAIDKVKDEMAVNVQLSHAIQQIRRGLGV